MAQLCGYFIWDSLFYWRTTSVWDCSSAVNVRRWDIFSTLMRLVIRLALCCTESIRIVLSPATCVPDEQLVFGYIYVDEYMSPDTMLLVRDTCWLYLGDIITIHLCHGRLVSICIQQQTGNILTTILLPIQKPCWRCKRGFRFMSAKLVRWWDWDQILWFLLH